jgi:hypothetical protein
MNTREEAEKFLNKRTKQKENLVISRGEALSALEDFAKHILLIDYIEKID